jgi:hypothetical protein
MSVSPNAWAFFDGELTVFLPLHKSGEGINAQDNARHGRGICNCELQPCKKRKKERKEKR